jgi:hypothetical protein
MTSGQIEPAQVPVLIPSLSKVKVRSTAAARAAFGVAKPPARPNKPANATAVNALNFIEPSYKIPHSPENLNIRRMVNNGATNRLSIQNGPIRRNTQVGLRGFRKRL